MIDVVDGQQRITTIIIFMKVLLSQLSSRLTEEEFLNHGLDLVNETYVKNKGRAKLQAISPDNDFFQSYILGDDDGQGFIQTPSQRRLFNAKKYFINQLGGKTTEALLELRTKIDTCTKVLTYSVKDAAEATLIFETTNDRGKRLTNLEKIKSFLMYKTYLAAGENLEGHLSLIQERFTEIYRELELFDDKVSEDAALQYHCIAFEAWSDKADYQQPVNYIRKKVNPLINKGQKYDALQFIERFSKELKESFQTLRSMMESECIYYRDLVCQDRLANFYPLLIKCYKLDKSKEKADFNAVCRFLEIYSFRVFAVQQTRSNTGQPALYSAAKEFKGKFEPLYDKLTKLIKSHSSRKMFKDHLEYADFYKFMKPRDISYLFWKYENFLRESEQPVCAHMSENEFRSIDKKTFLTVEHIASQNPKDAGILQSFDVLPELDDEFLESHIHRLGNLTFDPTSANSSKGNKPFEHKNFKYFKAAPYKTQNELESFIVNKEWGVKSITKREKKIVDFCLKYWNPEFVEY